MYTYTPNPNTAFKAKVKVGGCERKGKNITKIDLRALINIPKIPTKWLHLKLILWTFYI